MDNIARLTAEERSQIFSETAARMGTTPAIVEKDFWVCWVLEKIFMTDWRSTVGPTKIGLEKS